SANPHEIAYFDRGPVDADQSVLGGFWSVYWYNGRIYGTEIARGLDVLELAPSDFLSENEIAAAKLASQGETFNPQQQYPVTWPDAPVVARAYIDQLQRKEPMSDAQLKPLYDLLDAAETGDASVAAALEQMADDLSEGDPLVGKLAATLRGIAANLR
ncbi:MAG: hypothetical protein R3D99_06985, partial [Altererythrobacter sp.]